jgi:GAF domain-containing protein
VGLFDHSGSCIYTHHTFGADVPHLDPGTGITACVLSTRESVIIQDVRKPETFPASVQDCHYRPERSDTRAEIIVPLRLDQDCILGVIIVQSPHENWFDHSLVKIIESLANNAALVIRNTQHRRTLAELSTVGSKLAVGESNKLNEMLGERTPEQLREASYQSLTANAKNVLEKHFETTVNDHRIGGLSAVEITIEDLELPYRWLAWQHVNALPAWQDSKRADLIYRGKNVGDITIYTTREHAFSEDDQHLLEALASYLNTEVSNIRRRYRSDLGTNALIEIDNQIKELVETKQANGAKPYKPIWKFIAKKAMELTDAQEASIFTIADKPSRGILRVVSLPESAETPEGEFFEFGDKTRLSTIVAETGEPIIVFDRKDYPELIHTTFESMIGIPLYDASQEGRPEVIAVMNIRSHHPRAFDVSDVPLLQALANQGVVAYKFARLIDQTRQIARVGDAISAEAAHIDIKKAADDILHSIVEALSREGRDTRGIIRILNPLDATLDELSVSGFNLDEAEFRDYRAKNRQFPIYEYGQPRGLIGWVVENAGGDSTGRPVDSSQGQTPASRIIGIYGIQSQMSIAIRGGRALEENRLPHDLRKRHVVRGVISILSSKENAFSWLDYELLTAFAKVIEQVWARIRYQKRIEALAKVARHGSKQSDNLTKFYKYIWETIYDMFFAEQESLETDSKKFVGTLYLYDGFSQLRRVLGTGQQEVYEQNYQRIDVDFNGTRELGVQAWVAGSNAHKDAKKKPIYLNVPDITFQEGREAIASDDTVLPFTNGKFPISGLQHTENNLPSISELCVPILSSDDELVGTLNIESPVLHAFDDNDAQFLIAIGRQVAYALEGKALRDAEELSLRRHGELDLLHKLHYFIDEIRKAHYVPPDPKAKADQYYRDYEKLKARRQQPIKQKTTSTSKIWEEVKELIREALWTDENGKQHNLNDVSIHSDLQMSVEASLTDVVSILQDFILNSLKHRNNKARKGVSVQATPNHDTGTVRIEVWDEGEIPLGVMMQSEETDRMLERLLGVNQQGTETGSGIGLGLAMASLIARACGGRIILDYHNGNEYLGPGFSASIVLKAVDDNSNNTSDVK